uniref:Uncharacterized protein n=1 Tax=Fagus sylvatica TaxID=28930 RepID=A0A2N9EJJ2_FAGSY
MRAADYAVSGQGLRRCATAGEEVNWSRLARLRRDCDSMRRSQAEPQAVSVQSNEVKACAAFNSSGSS